MKTKAKTTSGRIKHIQSHLKLEPDGIVGPATLTAIENKLFDDKQLKNIHSLTISDAGMNQLIQHEIVSTSYYKRLLKHPIWPGGNSGVTIGIGYDLGYNRASSIQKDWRGKMSDVHLEKLKKVSGFKGDKAKKSLSRVKSVDVAFDDAKSVFSESTLPRYAASARKAYPGIEKLLPDAQAALLSLVYNRGVSMSGSRRKEMAAIRPLVLKKDYAGIAHEIQSMKRLWVGKNLSGLLKRRDDEAHLVSNANRNYDKEKLIRV